MTGSVNITVVRLTGDIAFGPRELDRGCNVKVLKALFERGRPKTMVYKSRILLDADTFLDFPEEALIMAKFEDALQYDSPNDVEDVIANSYTVWEKLGQGTFGNVYKAARIGHDPPEFVAIKKMPIDDGEGVPTTTLREISTLRGCSHPNVITFLDVLCTSRNVYLVMELGDLDLGAYLKSCGPFGNLQPLKNIARSCFEALAYCHCRAILHRDIKPQNIVLNLTTMQVKLCDFGLSRVQRNANTCLTYEVVSLWYRPPEILLGQAWYGPGADIWSMGCVCIELATGRAQFEGDSEIETIFLIFKFLGTPTEAMWPGVSTLHHFQVTFPQWDAKPLERIALENPVLDAHALHLFMACLAYDAVRRPSARQCLRHEFFTTQQL